MIDIHLQDITIFGTVVLKGFCFYVSPIFCESFVDDGNGGYINPFVWKEVDTFKPLIGVGIIGILCCVFALIIYPLFFICNKVLFNTKGVKQA